MDRLITAGTWEGAPIPNELAIATTNDALSAEGRPANSRAIFPRVARRSRRGGAIGGPFGYCCIAPILRRRGFAVTAPHGSATTTQATRDDRVIDGTSSASRDRCSGPLYP